jgi:hypothetical protein
MWSFFCPIHANYDETGDWWDWDDDGWDDWDDDGDWDGWDDGDWDDDDDNWDDDNWLYSGIVDYCPLCEPLPGDGVGGGSQYINPITGDIWGCYVTGDCNIILPGEVEVTPPNPPNPCEGANPDPCECFGECGNYCENNPGMCNQDPCENGTGDPCMCYGDCDESSGTGNETSNEPLPDIKIPYTAQQYKLTGGYNKNSCDCMCVAQKVMKQILGNNANIGSPTNTIKLYNAPNGVLVPDPNVGAKAQTIFETLNAHLDANRSILAGVDYTIGNYSHFGDGTDHYIVIIGRGYDADKSQYYFSYVDTAFENPSKAMSESNRLYYDPSSSDFMDESVNRLQGLIYTLTHIRPNN